MPFKFYASLGAPDVEVEVRVNEASSLSSKWYIQLHGEMACLMTFVSFVLFLTWVSPCRSGGPGLDLTILLPQRRSKKVFLLTQVNNEKA
jgi:hypothetical protein